MNSTGSHGGQEKDLAGDDEALQLLEIVRNLVVELHPQDARRLRVTLGSALDRDLGFDRERMNLPLDEIPPADPATAPLPVAPHGLDYRDEENLPFWWAMGSQSVWQILPITLLVGERENLWDAQFDSFRALRDLIWVPGDDAAPEALAFFLRALGRRQFVETHLRLPLLIRGTKPC